MKHYGLIGKPLGHSWSERYFTQLFRELCIEADYSPIEIANLNELHKLEQLDGYNVTLPYKSAILPYLDEVDGVAQQIGAVNVVLRRLAEGRTISRGYNTDYIGFAHSIRPWLRPGDNKAMILGSGGVAQAVKYELGLMSIEYTTISRSCERGICYQAITREMMEEHTVIVNCTPVGMWPHTNDCPPIPYEQIGPKHLLMDCIYNPTQTLFLQQGQHQGARCINGEEMLRIQADESWKIWNIDK